MMIYARLSLVVLVACSAAGEHELFPTAVTLLPEDLEAALPSKPDAPSDAPSSVAVAPSPPATPPNGDVPSAPAVNDSDRDIGGPPPVTDNVPPSLRATYPTDGEAGVPSNTEIVLEFSEAMDVSTTRVALRTSDGPVAVEQSWHRGARELRIEPALPLAYAAGGAETSALTYVVDVAEGARDASGNPLGAQAFSFQTLRRVTQTLLPVTSSELTGSFRGDGGAASPSCAEALCVGDDSFVAEPESEAQYRGFLSFDLAALPPELVEIVDARIRLEATSVEGDPFGVLGELRLERAAFDAIGDDAFAATPQATFAAMTSAEAGATGEHILWAVQADFDAQALHQYRLIFDRGSNRDDASDLALFDPQAQRLEITMLLP